MMNAEQDELCVFSVKMIAAKEVMTMPWREALCPRLTPELARLLRGMDARQAARLEEIRVYAGRAVELAAGRESLRTDVIIDGRRMDELLACLSGYALYSCEAQMAQGYIPLAGGHRAGVCGRMTREDGVWRMTQVSSVCLRIARHVPGASVPVRPHLIARDGRVRRVLLLGAPGCGKTTVLRDAAIDLAEEKGKRVAAADEREELFAAHMQGLSPRIDVLSGTGKAQAFAMLLRSMAPQAIVTDEIGSKEDADALSDAARCGVGVIASAHADGLEDLLGRPMLRALYDARTFERYIHLGWHGCVLHAYDGDGREIGGEDNGERKEEEQDGKLGCGGDGDDRNQRHRLFAL